MSEQIISQVPTDEQPYLEGKKWIRVNQFVFYILIELGDGDAEKGIQKLIRDSLAEVGVV